VKWNFHGGLMRWSANGDEWLFRDW
jgi:hypothetical protein